MIIPQGKIDWLYLDKGAWLKAMGYYKIDDFINVIREQILNAYCSGNYQKVEHTKFGFKINLFVSIPGIEEHKGKTYDLKSCFMIFPNGKLKCNTLVGGWSK